MLRRSLPSVVISYPNQHHKELTLINPDDPNQQQKVCDVIPYCCYLELHDLMSPQRQYATSVFAILESFGLMCMTSLLSQSGGINDLLSIITMASDLHQEFAQLEFWLEPTGTPHEILTMSSHLSWSRH